MRKMHKKLLAILLTVCLTVSLVPNVFSIGVDEMGVMRESDPVSSIAAINEQIDSDASSGNLVLTADINAAADGEQIVVPANQSVELDLCGHSMTRAASANAWFAVAGNLTITDSVGGGSISGGSFAVDNGRLTLAGGTIAGTGVLSGDSACLTIDGATVCGKFTMTGCKGVFVSGWYCEKLCPENGFTTSKYATSDCADAPNAAAAYTAVEQASYTVTYDLNLTHVNMETPPELIPVSNGELGASLGVSVEESEIKPMFLSYGTFDTMPHGVKTVLPVAASAEYSFTGWNTKADGTGIALGEEVEFTADTTVYAQWKPNFDALVYNQTTGIYFPTLSKAFSVANDGDVIMLADDCSENVTVPARRLTLDLNGFTLKAEASGNTVTVPVGAELTVTDNSTDRLGSICGGSLARAVCVNGGKLTLLGGTLESSCTERGSGVFVNAGSFTMENGTVNGNIARQDALLGVSLKGGMISEQTDEKHLDGSDSILNMLAENRILTMKGSMQKIIEKFVTGSVDAGVFTAQLAKADITGKVKLMVACYQDGQFVSIKSTQVNADTLPTSVNMEVDEGNEYQMFVLNENDIPYYAEKLQDLKPYELVLARGYWTNTDKGYEGNSNDAQNYVSTQKFDEDTLPANSEITVAEGYTVRLTKWSSYPRTCTTTNITDTFCIDKNFWNGTQYCAFDFAYCDDYQDVMQVSVPGKVADRRTMSWNNDNTLSILTVGNSFSDDAMEYIWQIAKAAGVQNVILGNLYYGGCTVDQHYDFWSNRKPFYDYRVNTDGQWKTYGSSYYDAAFGKYNWDFISFQQSAQVVQSNPALLTHLEYLMSTAKQKCPNAKLIWHQPWANPHANYGNDTETMFRDCMTADRQLIENFGFDEIITTGVGVQNARTSYVPTSSFVRDGWHLSYQFGRYIAGLTFFTELTGISVADLSFAPSGLSEEYKLIAIEAAENARMSPRIVTQSVYTK